MKNLGLLFIALFSILVISCNSCKHEKQNVLNVEKCTAEAHAYMNSIAADKEYRWLETCIDFKYWIDDYDSTNYATAVGNVFEIMEIDSIGNLKDCHVYLIIHELNHEMTVDIKQGVWVGDNPLYIDSIPICLGEAYERMMKSNCVKPHSRHCVLRKEVGPIDTTAQYVFGNQKCQAYVNVVTGDVSNHNPCFPYKYELTAGRVDSL